MRKLKGCSIFIILVIAAYFILAKLNVIPTLTGIFKPEPVFIDQTPILIKQIRSIGQLISYSSYDEVVADSLIISKGAALINSINRFAPVDLLPSAEKQLVIIGRGKILAGTDLSALSDSSVQISNDTVLISIPKAQILDAILNPTDFETFIEKGQWTSEEVALVKNTAKRKMIQRAADNGIIEKADKKSRSIIEKFLQDVGYKKVILLENKL